MNLSGISICLPHGLATILTAAALLILFGPIVSIAQDKSSVIAISDAEKLPLGTQITIGGTVTLASGTFRSSFSDEGFQIEDKTAGMYVRVKTNLHLTVGQTVLLTGNLSETALKFQIVETDESRVKVASVTTRPKPIKLSTGAINEPVIGKLIKITAKVTKPVDEVAPYGFRVSVDDGSGEIIAYVSNSTDISQKAFVTGRRVELIGIAGKFNEHFQIYPRAPGDVKVIGMNREKKKVTDHSRQN